jgi:hypothetical protein
MVDSWPGSRKKRDALMRLPIGELAAWHMMVMCAACRDERAVMVRDLVTRYGVSPTLAGIVPRLRCKGTGCRRVPAYVTLRSKFPAQPGPDVIEVVLKEPGRA